MSRLTSLHRLVLAICALLFFGLGATAKADTVIIIIIIIGNQTGSASSADLTCGFDAATNNLNFTISNTSPFNARITGIGFDLPPNGNANPSGLNGFSGSVTNQGGASFAFSDASLGNVPQFNSAVLDFGFITGSDFAGGNPNNGLAPGNTASFSVSGAAFTGFTHEQICNAIFVRFQGVGQDGQGSDVGIPTPEPTTILLLGTGFAGIAARIRKRRKVVKLE
jgi:hypothetical protein